MKKSFVLLLSILLLISVPAYALKGSGYPSYDGSGCRDNSLCGNLAGSDLVLEFDETADYSYLCDDYLQACFFAFDAEEEYYIELYLMLPPDISAGMTLTPETAFSDGTRDCGVTLYEINGNEERDSYYASQIMGMPVPAQSGYSIGIDRVSRELDTVTVSGTLDAVLGRLVPGNTAVDTLEIRGAEFNFTFSAAGVYATPVPDVPREDFPEEDEAPGAFDFFRSTVPPPAFTLPPDSRKI